jgi:small subunit ribosomal protein S1
MDESWWAAILAEDAEKERGKGRKGDASGEGRMPPMNPEDWQWAQELYEADDTVELPIIGSNRGGLLVEARSLRGFIPLSHLLGYDPEAGEEENLRRVSQRVGETINLKVIELDPARGRLVFSERAAVAGPGRRMELLAQLQPGDTVRGTVTNITSFGVFVDLGGLEGLIHVSELSWGRVRHPQDVVSCGQAVQVKVLSVDREKCRVALSLKDLLPDPWQDVEERYQVGDIVEGVVTNVVKFGAFVGIEEGLEGLIHVSELGNGHFLHPRNVLSEGERVRVRVIHIDAASRRLGLSLRRVSQQPQDGEEVAPETREAMSSV